MSPFEEILICALAAQGLAESYDDLGAAALAAKLEAIAESLNSQSKTTLIDDLTIPADHLMEAE